MMKNILVLYLFCAFLTGIALCQQDMEIDSQIISINPDKEYMIIKAGEKQGVEIGDGLIVHRNAEKLADAQIIEVRPDVAAAEILNIEKEIKEGDNILIVKKANKTHLVKATKKDVYREPKKNIWTSLFGPKSKAVSKVPAESVISDSETSGKILMSDRGHIRQDISVVKADINKNLSAVFPYSLMVLRENGYSVILSNRATGIILATKPIELSLMKELLADATASIGHKLIVSLEMKNNEGTTELNIVSFEEHAQKGKQIKLPVRQTSQYYRALVNLASEIKERAEQ
jgi:hypothetical protein